MLAAAIALKGTVHDLDTLELTYAPPYNSPRDPINLAGSAASGEIRGNVAVIYPEDLPKFAENGGFLLDVRDPDVFASGSAPGAVNIPMRELRDRIAEIPRSRPIAAICSSGALSTNAMRALRQLGYDCMNLQGGMAAWKVLHEEIVVREPARREFPKSEALAPAEAVSEEAFDVVIDARGLTCPGPIVKMKKRLAEEKGGTSFRVMASDHIFVDDFRAWCQRFGHQVVRAGACADGFEGVGILSLNKK